MQRNKMKLEGNEEKTQKKEKQKNKRKKITRKKVEVDFWKTDLHGKEIGIRQKDQQRAKSRQFSKDMDLYGAIEIDGEKAGNIGYRTAPWEEDGLTDGQMRRLVIRYFSENDQWIASIEESTIKGLLRSVGKEEPLPVFNIFHKGISKIFPLERIEKEWGQMDKIIIPLILDDDSNMVEFFIFSEKRFTLGKDWKIFRASNPKKTIAEVDDKKFNIGGKVEIEIYDSDLAEENIFVNTLILFGALLKYWDKVIEDMKFSYINYRKGRFTFQPDHLELELLENPRRYSR